MHDERWEAGMPVLDRQAAGPAGPPGMRDQPPRSVPEVAPTPLRRHYVLMSTIPLVCGAVAITALELNAGLGSPIVKLAVIVGAPILVLTTLDATLRIWRSAWAWMDVDRGRGLFRLTWAVAALTGLAAIVLGSYLVLAA
jgi:hypothetical protein